MPVLIAWLRTPQWASHWWFPMACLYAAAILPLSLAALFQQINLPDLANPGAHAQQLLFGFAMALIAGYLCGRTPRWQLILLIGCWLMARIPPLVGSAPWLSVLGQTAFCLGLLWLLLPRFAKARRWSNLMLVPLLSALALLAVANSWLLPDHQHWLWRQRLSSHMLLLLALLMMFMGGRSLAPAVTHAQQKRGLTSAVRLQPKLEGWLIGLIGGASISAPWLPVPASAMLLAAGMLSLVRLWRWQLQHLLSQPFILGMTLGHLWLAAGMLGCALALLEIGSWQTAVHMITAGALGTLSSAIMLRSLTQRLPVNLPATLQLGIWLLIALATGLRLTANLLPQPQFGLWLAAIGWSSAFLLLTACWTWGLMAANTSGRR